MQAANFQRSLEMMGAGIAHRISKRQEHKQLLEALQGLAGPEMDYETTPPLATPPQRDDLMDAMSGAVAQDFTPEQRQASQMQAGQAAGAIRDNTRGIVEGANDKRSQMLKMAMLPGKVGEIAKMALMKSGGMIPELQGAQRYMNLGGGKVMDMVTKEELDYSDSPMADPGKRYKVVGKQLVDLGQLDKQGRPTVVIEEYDEGATKLQTIGAGKGMMTVAAVTTKDNKVISVVPVGETWERKQFSEVRTGDLVDKLGPSYARVQKLDYERLDNYGVRLDEIAKTYDPFYQTYRGKLSFGLGQVLDKAEILNVLGADGYKKFIREMGAFTQNVNSNVNLYIKEITGAQMSEAEADRLKKAVANLGDSPQLFEAKLANSMAQLDAAKERKKVLIDELMSDGLGYKEAKVEAEKEFQDVYEQVVSGLEAGYAGDLPDGWK